MSITAFIPAFKGSCPAVLFTSSQLGLFLFLGDEALCAVYLFMKVSKERKLQLGEWDASPERMVQLVHILFVLMYAAVMVCNCVMSPRQVCAFSVPGDSRHQM